MLPAIIIIIIMLAGGTVSGLLILRAGPIARVMWPGPSVKGPADIYVQAFQTLLCIALLGLLALSAAVGAFFVSRWCGWTAGQWLSVVPILTTVIVLAVATGARGR